VLIFKLMVHYALACSAGAQPCLDREQDNVLATFWIYILRISPYADLQAAILSQ